MPSLARSEAITTIAIARLAKGCSMLSKREKNGDGEAQLSQQKEKNEDPNTRRNDPEMEKISMES